MAARIYELRPSDTWFFKGAMSFDAVGGNEFSSVFPPPAKTVAGALRNAIGRTAGVDWRRYSEGDGKAHSIDGIDLIDEMGDSSSLGKLRIRGPWISLGGSRLFPMPSSIVGILRPSSVGEKPASLDELVCMQPGTRAVDTDIGRVLLPRMEESRPGAKTLKGWWLKPEGMRQFLGGETPETRHAICSSELFERESRLGIARDSETHTALEGLLYQTSHLRLHEGVSVVFVADGIDERLYPQDCIVKLGGEGRTAHLRYLRGDEAAGIDIPRAEHSGSQHYLTLTLQTNADFGGKWLPSGFEPTAKVPLTWEGTLAGLSAEIVSAVLERPARVGGWDMAGHRPRAVRSLVPMGSVYFLEPVNGLQDMLREDRSLALGCETEFGRGEMAIGIAKKGRA